MLNRLKSETEYSFYLLTRKEPLIVLGGITGLLVVIGLIS